MWVSRRLRVRAGLLSSAAVAAVVLSGPLLFASPAHANGGTGGAACEGTLSGGAGGTGFGGGSGTIGSTTTTCNATDASSGGGGGAAGGGAGGAGGSDGSGNTGGSGGAGGANGNGSGATTITNVAPLAGGNGGTGGNGAGSSNESGGGGGGAGGYGALVTGSGTDSNSSTITGGNGGAGGTGQTGATAGTGGSGGNGGDGGIGILFETSGVTFTNTGTVTGGNGGAGGTGGFANGSAGTGGVGIVGGGLTIINSGTISGGLGGDGTTRADAIDFTSGVNTLEIDAGSTIIGNVVAFSTSDTLALGGTTNSSFDVSTIGAQYQGFGVYVKTGSSTWTLTGTTSNNAVTSWQIDSGTLAISSDTNLGDPSGHLTLNGGALQFLADVSSARTITITASNGTFDANGTTDTLSGPIGGLGMLTKVGSGTLILSGTDTYSGNTVISAGTLQIGAGGTTGSIVGDVTDNGTLSFDRSDSYTFSGLISGSGNLVQAGTGTTVLTNDETYTGTTTINAGTLQIGNGGTTGSLVGGTSGSIVPDITDNGTLALDRSDPIVLNNLISGTGGLTQLGTGTLTIPNTQSYTGATIVKHGTLIVTGSVASSSSTIVESGATLIGNGTVSSLAVFGGGTVAPGSAGTTLNVAGDATFSPGATYVAQMTTANPDMLDISGAATLAGTINLHPSGSFTLGEELVVLTADSITGNFQSVTTTGSFGVNRVGEVSYDGTHVIVTVDAATITPFLPAIANTNERNVTLAIDFAMMHDGAVPVFAPLALLSPADLLKSLDAFTGEVGTSTQYASIGAMNGFLDTLDSKATLLGPAAGPQYASRYDYVQLADNESPDGLFLKPSSPARRLEVWGSLHGEYNRTEADVSLGTHSTQADDLGAVIGFGYRAPSGKGTIGIALGYDDLTWKLSKDLGKGRATAYQGGLYGSLLFGQTYVSATATFGTYQASTDRTFVYAGTNSYHSKLSANSEGAHLEIGENLSTVLGHLAPYVRGSLQDLHTPAYTENTVSGSPAFALSYEKVGHVDLTSEVGASYNTNLSEAEGDAFGMRFRLGWLHDYSAGLKDSATFSGFTGATFTVHGASPPKDAAHAIVGLEQDFNAFALTLDAEVVLATSSQSVGAANAGIAYRW